MLNRVQWYSRTDAALVGTPGLAIEVRYGLASTDLRYRQRITGGILCGTIYVRGSFRGESGTATCPGAPVTLADGPTTLITLQGIYPYYTFLMAGEVVVS